MSVEVKRTPNECSLFDLYGTVWKDGREGCTMSYQTLAKNERIVHGSEVKT